MDLTENRPDSDITLGEVNRNVIRVEKAMQDQSKQYISRVEHEALVRRVRNLEDSGASKGDIAELRGAIEDLKNNLKSRGTNFLSLAGILVPSAIAIWAVVHG